MDFSLSEEQQALRDHVIRFAHRRLNKGVSERDQEQVFPHDLWLECGKMQFQGLPVPESYGGAGYDLCAFTGRCDSYLETWQRRTEAALFASSL